MLLVKKVSLEPCLSSQNIVSYHTLDFLYCDFHSVLITFATFRFLDQIIGKGQFWQQKQDSGRNYNPWCLKQKFFYVFKRIGPIIWGRNIFGLRVELMLLSVLCDVNRVTVISTFDFNTKCTVISIEMEAINGIFYLIAGYLVGAHRCYFWLRKCM